MSPNTRTISKQKPEIFRGEIDLAENTAYIAYMFNQANRGLTHELYKYARQIEERDFEISGLLNLRKSSVKSSKAYAVPHESQRNNPLAVEIAQFTQSVMDNIMPNPQTGLTDFEGLQDNMMHSLMSGISCSQIHWKEGGRGIEGFEFFEPTNFSFYNSYKPQLKYRDSETYKSLTPYKWVYHTHNPRGGDATRGGLIRPLAYLYFFKSYVYRFNIRAIEKFLIPFVSLMADSKDLSDDTKYRQLQEQLSNFGADGGGLFSTGTEINYEQIKGDQADIYNTFHTMCRQQASQIIIGSDSGVYADGSNRSTASVQDSVRKSIIMNDEADLRRSIRSQVFKPLVEFNYGKDAPVPDVQFRNELSLAEWGQTLEQFSEAGYTLPESELQKYTGYQWEKTVTESEETINVEEES